MTEKRGTGEAAVPTDDEDDVQGETAREVSRVVKDDVLVVVVVSEPDEGDRGGSKVKFSSNNMFVLSVFTPFFSSSFDQVVSERWSVQKRIW